MLTLYSAEFSTIQASSSSQLMVPDATARPTRATSSLVGWIWMPLVKGLVNILQGGIQQAEVPHSGVAARFLRDQLVQ